MASDESLTIQSSIFEDDCDDTDDGLFDHHHHHPHNLSRLSMCTSSMCTNGDDDDVDDGYGDEYGMRMYMSRLSIESFDADADEEYSDEKEDKQLLDLSSDSDKELGYYSLPPTPSCRRNRGGLLMNRQIIGAKDYASEDEAQKCNNISKEKTRKNLRKRRIIRERGKENYGNSVSGESDQGGGGGGGGGVVVITRPKGGSRSLCMDLDEVKACRDLGFELEHERMLEMPSRLSLSGSNLDTSSGGNSPIANWRISSPGDDPRDVKARLKVWAQAVALASASRHCI